MCGGWYNGKVDEIDYTDSLWPLDGGHIFSSLVSELEAHPSTYVLCHKRPPTWDHRCLSLLDGGNNRGLAAPPDKQ